MPKSAAIRGRTLSVIQEPPGRRGAPSEEKPASTEAVLKVGAGQPKPLEDLHIDELLHVVVDRNCSDLHICAHSEPVIREDGQLKRLNYEKFTPHSI